MSRLPRRAALGVLAFGAVGALAGDSFAAALRRTVPPPLVGELPTQDNPIKAENRLRGSRRWAIGGDHTRTADDIGSQIQGYASTTSADVGESVDFFVTVNPAQDLTIGIYRLGFYDGDGARHVVSSPVLRGITQRWPKMDPDTGLFACQWSRTWTVQVGPEWTPGLYLAVFTSAGSWRSVTPFVVRDDRSSAQLCVVLPFSTYQAYNQWPNDGRTGKSLYHGYPLTAAERAADPSGSAHRAVKVSFDRPYGYGGKPNLFDSDHDAVRWVERAGYDVTYASIMDLHDGRVDPSRYAGVVFVGHDEYWTQAIRTTTEQAVAARTSLAFLTANNAYWHIRLEPSGDGRPDRVVVCYRDADPAPDASGPTQRWRDLSGGTAAEQRLIGVQYNGIVPKPQPLVVQAADHWVWAGSGVTDGEHIDKMVGPEADGFFPGSPRPQSVRQVLLSQSPYRLANGTMKIQNSSLYETTRGAVVFAAGALNWPLGLNRSGYWNPSIQIATANVVNRMLRRVV